MGSWKDKPRAPKPYGFVRIDPLRREDRTNPANVGHDSYKKGKFSGTLRGEIQVLSPVHVASGTLELQNDPDAPLYKAHIRSSGRVIIPGSTLKGVARSVVEAISASCVRITRAKRQELPNGSQGCSQKDKLCVACLMFGATGRNWGYRGRVRFADAFLRDEYRTALAGIPALHAPGQKSTIPYFNGGRIEKRGRRLVVTGGRVKGRKFYHHGQPATGNVPVEVCPTRATLDFALHFDNLASAELGLLLTALGLGDPPLVLKLGGGKPVCYGSIRVRLSGLDVFEDMATLYSDYDAAQEAAGNPTPYLAAARELIRGERLKALAELLRVDAGRECPEGNY